MAAFVIAMFFSPDLKGILIQGLMRIGLFQPDVPEGGGVKTKLSFTSDAAFRDKNGALVKLSDLKGKVVFINFWATWCPPCIAEMPSIDKLHRKYKGYNEVVFLMVDVDGKIESSVEFMKKRNFMLQVYTPASAIPVEYFSGSMPTTVILDKSSNVVFQQVGAADYSNIEVAVFIDKLRL
ncbi:MAG: TlpA family protein disulfide reductase [Pedobacter sp.]|nr:TlpA family protein disulfide reductase [Pedobacter sp.]